MSFQLDKAPNVYRPFVALRDLLVSLQAEEPTVRALRVADVVQFIRKVQGVKEFLCFQTKHTVRLGVDVIGIAHYIRSKRNFVAFSVKS